MYNAERQTIIFDAKGMNTKYIKQKNIKCGVSLDSCKAIHGKCQKMGAARKLQ